MPPDQINIHDLPKQVESKAMPDRGHEHFSPNNLSVAQAEELAIVLFRYIGDKIDRKMDDKMSGLNQTIDTKLGELRKDLKENNRAVNKQDRKMSYFSGGISAIAFLVSIYAVYRSSH